MVRRHGPPVPIAVRPIGSAAGATLDIEGHVGRMTDDGVLVGGRTLAAMKLAGAVLCPVIVGRDDILDLFDHRISEAQRGRGHALFLSGPAGLGKTRLVRAVGRKAVAAELRFDGGGVGPQDVEVPLQAIREMAIGMRNNRDFGTLSADLLAFDGRHDGDALGSRRLLVRGIADRILEAIDRPTLLVFDDLHWADEMSLEVIGELARFCAEKPLLLLGGYRPDEFPAGSIHREWRARILHQRYGEEIRLRPLTLEETAIATTLILGSELPAPREVVEAVYERTNGIPLHIEELLGALDEDARADGQRIRDAQVPDTIEGAVLARMERLSAEARLVARAGAVVGRCFSPDVIAGIMNRPLAELEDSIQELVDAAILHPFDYVDEGYYDFRHQLLRDAVYSTVPPSQLRRFHAQVAEFGMALEGAHLIHASRHFERAGLHKQAFKAAMSAAQEASRISARHEAYELYRRAIANMPADLPVGEQAELFELFADAAGAIEHNAECVTASTRARELYLAAGQALDAAGMLLNIGLMGGRDGGPLHAQLNTFEQGFGEVCGEPQSQARDKLLASLHGARALRLVDAWRLDEARADATESLRLATAIGDEPTVLEAGLTLARIGIGQGHLEHGLADGMRLARDARDRGHEGVGVTGFHRLAVLAARVNEPAMARVAIAEGVRYADAIEQSHCRQMMATASALLAWAAGDWDAADAAARRELVDRGCRLGSLGGLDVLGLVALGRGQLDEAQRRLEESLDAGRRADEPALILAPLWGLAELDLIGGRPAAAADRCEEALELAVRVGERPLFALFVVSGVRARLATHQTAEAERWLTRAESHLAAWQGVAPVALAHARGLVLLSSGSLTAARGAVAAAVSGWTEKERIWEASWARLDLAQCLLRSNRYGEAASVLAAVRTTAEGLRSEPLLRRAEELSRIGRARGTIEEPWRPLTAREFEVARLIADGLTNGEIAERLEIAPKTASSHVEHILAKLSVSRRAEIATWVATVAMPANPSSEAQSDGSWPDLSGGSGLRPAVLGQR
ncbi:MAG: AAA family ATPase [Candidatus Limnocylindrales bacterium]